MKPFLVLFFLLISNFSINAQIEEVETDGGSSDNQVTDIVVVFKMHVDIGYTNRAEGVLQQYCDHMLGETLRSIDETEDLPRSEQFVWTIPSWPLKYMLENCSDEYKSKLEKAIREERIIPHALPVTYETEASDLENLVRGLSYASEINRSHGLPPPRDAKLTDVPSHSWILPTLLKNAGIDFLHIGCNPGSASPEIPDLFWWEGPDGSRLLTLYWAEYYGSGILPPKGWPHKTWLAMIHTHENSGAPTPEEVAKLLKTAKEEMPNVNIKIGHLSDFYDLLMKENPELPVISKDMPDTWIHGYMSMPQETKLSKRLQRETYDTEILNTQLSQWLKVDQPIETYIDEAVENMILYDEHTFGLAMSHGNQHYWTYNDEFRIHNSLGYYDLIEGSWEEKGNRIKEAERIITPLLRRELKQLASSVEVDGKRIVVYNPLPWARDGRVHMFSGVYQKKFKIYGLKDSETGHLISVYEDYNFISFDVESIPSMGYKTYIPILEPIEKRSYQIIDKDQNSIENQYFKLKINSETGSISSIYDLKKGKELVDQNSEEGFASYIYEQIGQEQLDSYNNEYIKPGAEGWANDEMIRPSVSHSGNWVFKGKCERIEYKDMGNAVRASVICNLNDSESQKYTVSYTLYENQPYIEITWGIHGKRPNPVPEAGWLSFPFALENPEYRLYRTGGIVDPQKEFIKRSNHEFYFLNTSMTMFDQSGGGVVLNCPDAPGISIDYPGLFKFSETKDLSTGKVYANLYNNQWGTNFTEWIEGSFSSTFYIWNYDAYNSEESFITPSEETRIPLYGMYFDGKKGGLPPSQGGISLSRKGVLLTAFGENRDGEGTILRLWEQAGNGGICNIILSEGSGFKKANLCNLRGEIISNTEINILKNSFEIMIGANQPVSLILK